MKTTFRIARLELSNLFYSPIAWFLLIVFLFQCGLSYTNAIEGIVMNQELYPHPKGMPGMTGIFPPPFGILADITGKLYLYLPLLTMGIMSREISSGTIKLLYSSPIRIREIIVGKYLALMVYCLLLTLVVGIFVVTGLINIEHVDTGLLLAGLLGIFVLLCTYSAIGLFMSCLTSYQVVAALSTLVMFAVLSYVGTLWQGVDFVRDLTYFLAINGRVTKMQVGLVTTKDLFYFALIIYIFLGFSIYKLQAGRESTSWVVRAGRYVLIFVSALTIGYITSRPGLIGYWDTTVTKSNTLTPNTQKIISAMGKTPLQVNSYINMMEGHYWYGRPEERNTDMDRWERYVRFKPDIKFNYVYYYDSTMDGRLWKRFPGLSLQQAAEKFAKVEKLDLNRFKTPREIAGIIDLKPELNRYVMHLDYNGKSTFLRLFDDPKVFPGETETSAALKRLTTTLPMIAFLDGEYERSTGKMDDRAYTVLSSQITFRYALVNQGFDVETLQPGQEIPTNIAALVIGDPRTSFSPETLARIQRYVDAGGNLFVTGEPGKQAILNPIIKPLGVQLMDGTIVQESKKFSPDLVTPYLTDTAVGFGKPLIQEQEDSFPVAMRGVAGLTYDSTGPFDIKPLLITDANRTWNKKEKLVLDSADIVYDSAHGDKKASYPTVVRLTRKVNGKEQRIVVSGDADFLSNGELMGRWNMQTSNFDFITAIFGWFTYGEFPIDATRPKLKDNKLDVSSAGFAWLQWLFLGILPGLLLLIGTVLLIRRKRK